MALNKGKSSSKLKIRRGKKRWFPVLAPAIFQSKEVAQITAYEPNELIGRNLIIPMKVITGSSRDSNVNVKLHVSKVQGDTAHTESIGIFTSDAQISRTARRKVSRINSVFYASDKNDNKIKLKIILMTKDAITKSLQNELRILSEEIITKSLKKMDASSLFTSESIKKIGNSIKKNLKIVYPLSDAIIWKASIMQK